MNFPGLMKSMIPTTQELYSTPKPDKQRLMPRPITMKLQNTKDRD